MNGDQNSIALFFAVIIVLGVALFFSFLNQLFVHPWLLIFVAAAGLCYYLARRAQRRERGEFADKSKYDSKSKNKGK